LKTISKGLVCFEQKTEHVILHPGAQQFSDLVLPFPKDTENVPASHSL
jgi:hypothetical protein